MINHYLLHMRLLDIGCGGGHYLLLAKKHFDELFGVDYPLPRYEFEEASFFDYI